MKSGSNIPPSLAFRGYISFFQLLSTFRDWMWEVSSP